MLAIISNFTGSRLSEVISSSVLGVLDGTLPSVRIKSIVEGVSQSDIGLYVEMSGWERIMGLLSIKSLRIVPALLLQISSSSRSK